MYPPPVEKFLSESTVHSLVHYTGERRLYVKVIWLAALIVSFTFCCMRMTEATTKFYSREITTTVKEGTLSYEFPDVHICNENPISGSYSVTLSSWNEDLLNEYKRKVNDTVRKTINKDNWLEEYSLRMFNSLPYKFLSDVMGHQIWQSVIDLTINDVDKRRIAIANSHNTFLNCIWLNLSDADRGLMSSPFSRLSLTLFTDPPLPAPFDNSSQQDVFGSLNLKPYDWDINYGYDYSRATGFRVFLVPEGQQLSEWSTQFVVGGGQRMEAEIRMEDFVIKPDDFPGQCFDAPSSFTVDYVEQYSGEKDKFGYEAYACMHNELARISQERFNCSAFRHPLPWKYRQLPSCFNLTAVSALNLTHFYQNYALNRSSMMVDAIKLCRNKAPCKRRIYSIKQFSTAWPSDRLMNGYLVDLIEEKLITSPAVKGKYNLPGIRYLLSDSVSKAKDFLLQLTLSATDDKVTETQLSIAYNLNSLIADVGGLLGLFLGMSLLSLLELVELLHDCFMSIYHRLDKRQRAVTSPRDKGHMDTAPESICSFEIK